MARRRPTGGHRTPTNKFKNLANGYGQIIHLSGARRKPYAVYPPAVRTETVDQDGHKKTVYKRPPALCYVDDWLIGFTVLVKYHAGEYTPGDELEIAKTIHAGDSQSDQADAIQQLLAEYSVNFSAQKKIYRDQDKMTFTSVYQQWYTWKYEREGHKDYSTHTALSTKMAYNHSKQLHDIPFVEIGYLDLQKILDDAPLKGSSKAHVKKMWSELWKYARLSGITKENPIEGLQIKDVSNEHGEPFSEADIVRLWEYRSDPVAEMLLIMIFSGFRISAYKSLVVNLEDGYFQGGVKTAAGKDRIVPIHPDIRELVENRLEKYGKLLICSECCFRQKMKSWRKKHPGVIEKEHSPHDTRHTFSMLCEKYGVNEYDTKRMMGHAISDMTKGIYGHRTLSDLKNEIEKIKVLRPCCE